MPQLVGDLSRLPAWFPKGIELARLAKDPVKLFPPYCRYWREFYGSTPLGFALKERVRLNDFDKDWRIAVDRVKYASDGWRDLWALPDTIEDALKHGYDIKDDCEGIAAMVYAAWHDKLGAALIRIREGLIHATNFRQADFTIVDGCEPAGMGNIPRGKALEVLCAVR